MDVNGINHIDTTHNIRGVEIVKFDETTKTASANQEKVQIQDEVDISSTARRLNAAAATGRAAESGEIRYDLVNRLREEIANGTYDTERHLDVAMERLLSRLG